MLVIANASNCVVDKLTLAPDNNRGQCDSMSETCARQFIPFAEDMNIVYYDQVSATEHSQLVFYVLKASLSVSHTLCNL